MKFLPLLLLLAACGSTVDGPYEACRSGEGCSDGTACVETTLPQSAGYAGTFCTTGCNVSTDCGQLINNYDAICVNAQCYIQCPTGGQTCPYGTACLQFTDQNGDPINLCTP